jgi:hypothetical protein
MLDLELRMPIYYVEIRYQMLMISGTKVSYLSFNFVATFLLSN